MLGILTVKLSIFNCVYPQSYDLILMGKPLWLRISGVLHFWDKLMYFVKVCTTLFLSFIMLLRLCFFIAACPLAAQLDVPGLYCNEYNSRNAMVQKGEGSRFCAVWVTVSKNDSWVSKKSICLTQQAGLWWAIAELWRDWIEIGWKLGDKVPKDTWWLIPLGKWVITPIISGLTLLIPFITGVITHLLSGMSHQVVSILYFRENADDRSRIHLLASLISFLKVSNRLGTGASLRLPKDGCTMLHPASKIRVQAQYQKCITYFCFAISSLCGWFTLVLLSRVKFHQD